MTYDFPFLPAGNAPSRASSVWLSAHHDQDRRTEPSIASMPPHSLTQWIGTIDRYLQRSDVVQRWDITTMIDPFSNATVRYRIFRDVVTAIVQEHANLPNTPFRTDGWTSSDWQWLYAQTIGWGPAQQYCDDPDVQEIKINGTTIVVQRRGQPFLTVPHRFPSDDDGIRRAMLLAQMCGTVLDAARPQATIAVYRHVGVGAPTRIHASIPPVVDHPLICIRRGRDRPWTLETMGGTGALPVALARLLTGLLVGRCSILVAGVTGSGKTTMMEALLNSAVLRLAPLATHVVTVEDNTGEIVITPEAVWTASHVSPDRYRHLLIEALRQTPTFLCPGEIRSAEAAAVLAAMTTGHPVVTTIHADRPDAALNRLALLAQTDPHGLYANQPLLAIRDAYAAVDLVILMRHLPGGTRYVAEVATPHRHAAHAEPPHGDQAVGASLTVLYRATPDATMTHLTETWEIDPDAPESLPWALYQAWQRAQAWDHERQRHIGAATIETTIADAQRNDIPLSQRVELLTKAWQQTGDERLIGLCRTLLTDHHLDPTCRHLMDVGESLRRAVTDALLTRQWHTARRAWEQMRPHLVALTGALPDGIPATSWPEVGRLIDDVVTTETAILAAVAQATEVLASQRPWDAMRVIDRAVESVSPSVRHMISDEVWGKVRQVATAIRHSLTQGGPGVPMITDDMAAWTIGDDSPSGSVPSVTVDEPRRSV